MHLARRRFGWSGSAGSSRGEAVVERQPVEVGDEPPAARGADGHPTQDDSPPTLTAAEGWTGGPFIEDARADRPPDPPATPMRALPAALLAAAALGALAPVASAAPADRTIAQVAPNARGILHVWVTDLPGELNPRVRVYGPV